VRLGRALEELLDGDAGRTHEEPAIGKELKVLSSFTQATE